MDNELRPHLEAMEQRLNAHIEESWKALEERLIARIDESVTRLEERVGKRLRELETKLVAEFRKWSSPEDLRDLEYLQERIKRRANRPTGT
jgi:hypothetical protein